MRMRPIPRMSELLADAGHWGESWERQAQDMCCVTPLTRKARNRPVHRQSAAQWGLRGLSAMGTPTQHGTLQEPLVCILRRGDSISTKL